MTFLGEWGDRSQIATIAMAAGDDYWMVIFGALLGHFFCTGVAVLGGRAIAGRVSLKVGKYSLHVTSWIRREMPLANMPALVTVGGAVAFLVFAVIYFFEAFYV